MFTLTATGISIGMGSLRIAVTDKIGTLLDLARLQQTAIKIS